MVAAAIKSGTAIDRVSVESATYEAAEDLMLSRVPEGQRLSAICADQDS